MDSDKGRSAGAPRLLVVDDEPWEREALAKLLALNGYQVSEARSGAEAIAKLRCEPFDAVICDVTMPDMDGYEVTAALRDNPQTRDLTILLVSADAQSARQARGFDRGADDFVAKPIDVDALLARLRARLRSAVERETLRRLSEHDVVTGLLNRNAIETVLDRELQRSRRTGQAVSVAMIDVDDFKRINDTWGHSAGDEALRCLGEALLRRFRGSDSVGRVGGDEFLVVLPDTDEPRAQMLVRRIKRSFQTSPPRPPTVPTLIRISIGSATARTGELQARAIIARADAAMYQDKHRARIS
jgi:diguanylate cyclase (GGDEF)-like protein